MPRQQNFKSLKIGVQFVLAKHAPRLKTARAIRIFSKKSENSADYIAEHKPDSESRYWYKVTKTFAPNDKVVRIQ